MRSYQLIIPLFVVAAAGCGADEGPQRASVSGAIFVAGRPLESGTVRFVPIDGTEGPMATGPIIGGYYDLNEQNGPVAGKHRVEIEATDFLGFDLGDETAFQAALARNGGRLPHSPVAASYGRRSKLTAEIPAEGATELNFMLDPAPTHYASR